MSSKLAQAIMKIILLFLLLSVSSLSADTLNTNKSAVRNDSTFVKKVYITNNPSFLEKYGTLIGSLFAALIAFGSIKLTQFYQAKNDRKKSQNNYRGYLISMNALLLSHQQIVVGLKAELDKILEDFRMKKKLAYDKPFTYLPIDLIKDLYSKIISYDNYNIETLFHLTQYITSIDNLYNDLNFISLKNLNEEIKDEKEYSKRVEFYFQQLFGRIVMLGELLDRLTNEINIEINNLFGVTAEVIDRISEEENNKG